MECRPARLDLRPFYQFGRQADTALLFGAANGCERQFDAHPVNCIAMLSP
jgi:hypothetical protein